MTIDLDQLEAAARFSSAPLTLDSRDVSSLVRAVKAAEAVRVGSPFLDGTPGEDYGGHWVEFVAALEPFRADTANKT